MSSQYWILSRYIWRLLWQSPSPVSCPVFFVSSMGSARPPQLAFGCFRLVLHISSHAECRMYGWHSMYVPNTPCVSMDVTWVTAWSGYYNFGGFKNRLLLERFKMALELKTVLITWSGTVASLDLRYMGKRVYGYTYIPIYPLSPVVSYCLLLSPIVS